MNKSTEKTFASIMAEALDCLKPTVNWLTLPTLYAVTGISLYSSFDSQGKLITQPIQAEMSIKSIEYALEAMNIPFEIIKKFNSVYNEEYFRSRIRENFYLKKPVVAKMKKPLGWCLLTDYSEPINSMEITVSENDTAVIRDWYNQLDYFIVFSLPSRRMLDAQTLCKVIVKQKALYEYTGLSELHTIAYDETPQKVKSSSFVIQNLSYYRKLAAAFFSEIHTESFLFKDIGEKYDEISKILEKMYCLITSPYSNENRMEYESCVLQAIKMEKSAYEIMCCPM